jgi:hypothetical protein
MYSAPTRVGTLPENVLAAMRDRQAPDEQVVATRYAKPFTPPPPEPIPPPASWTALTPAPFPPLPTPAPFSTVEIKPKRSRFASVLWSLLVIMAFAVLGGLIGVLILTR